MIKIDTNLTPICYLPSNKLVCYKQGYLLVLDNDKIQGRYLLFNNFKERLCGRLNPLFRLLRLGIRTGLAVNENRIVFCCSNMLYEYDFISKSLSKGYCLGDNIHARVFSEIKGIRGFDDGIVFGGYLSNSDKNEVNIYCRITTDNWKVVHTFKSGEINHVHNIIADKYRQCLWILTGDFGKAAAIWKATDNFENVKLMLCNNQQYRSCACFPIKEGLLYATDTPYAPNYINLLKEDLTVIKLEKLSGSCIHACKCGNNYVFSSTVEPDGRENTLLNLLFKRKRGTAIEDNYVHIKAGNIEKGFHEIYKNEKDFWPYLFEFGMIKFPAGDNTSDILYFQPRATRQDDLALLQCNLKNEL